MPTKERCDCLNWCGDDPRLDALGRPGRDRVLPCPRLLVERIRAQRSTRAFQILQQLDGEDLLDKLIRLIELAPPQRGLRHLLDIAAAAPHSTKGEQAWN